MEGQMSDSTLNQGKASLKRQSHCKEINTLCVNLDLPITCASTDILVKALFSEFAGTFFVTLTNASAALALTETLSSQPNPNARMSIASAAVASGLTLTSLVYSLGPISGAHFNPSISLAFVLRGDVAYSWFFPYAIAQFSGGILASVLLAAIFPDDATHGYLGANHPIGAFNTETAFWMEFIGSIFLQLVVLGTASQGANIGSDSALAAGLSLAAMVAMLLPYGGGSLNPARSLGPSIIDTSPEIIRTMWIYIAAPFGAAVCIGIVLRWLKPRHDIKYVEIDSVDDGMTVASQNTMIPLLAFTEKTAPF